MFSHSYNDRDPFFLGPPMHEPPIQIVPCINGEPVVLPAGAWQCSNGTNNNPPNPMPTTPAPLGYYWAVNPVSSQWALYSIAGYMGGVYAHGPTIPQQNQFLTTIPALSNITTNLQQFFTDHRQLVILTAIGAAWYFLHKKGK